MSRLGLRLGPSSPRSPTRSWPSPPQTIPLGGGWKRQTPRHIYIYRVVLLVSFLFFWCFFFCFWYCFCFVRSFGFFLGFCWYSFLFSLDLFSGVFGMGFCCGTSVEVTPRVQLFLFFLVLFFVVLTSAALSFLFCIGFCVRIVVDIHVEGGLLRGRPSKKQTHM